MGTSQSKYFRRRNSGEEVKESYVNRTRPCRQIIEVVDDTQSNSIYVDKSGVILSSCCLSRNNVVKHTKKPECEPNSDIPWDCGPSLTGSTGIYPLEHRLLNSPNLTLLKSRMYKRRHRLNTTPNTVESADKFVQAGVGFVSLHDNKSNAFQPIFPYDYNISSQIIGNQAERDEGGLIEPSTSNESNLLSGEESVEAKCAAKIAADVVDSKCNASSLSKDNFRKTTKENHFIPNSKREKCGSNRGLKNVAYLGRKQLAFNPNVDKSSRLESRGRHMHLTKKAAPSTQIISPKWQIYSSITSRPPSHGFSRRKSNNCFKNVADLMQTAYAPRKFSSLLKERGYKRVAQ